KYGLHFLRTDRLTRDDLPRLFLWLTFAAYAIQLLASAFADRSGALTGNLQVRIFTPFTLLVMPLEALTVWDFFQGLRSPVMRRACVGVGMVTMLWFSATSLLKAPIDPLVGYKWIFNTSPEQRAENWVVAHVPAGNTVWSGFDERLLVGAYFAN